MPAVNYIATGGIMSKRRGRDNRSNQLNPNNHVYWQSRGLEGRPKSWRQDSGKSTGSREEQTAKGKSAKR